MIITSHFFRFRSRILSSCDPVKTRCAYHSTKNFEIFETGTKGMEISWEKFHKIRKLLNFRKANRKFRYENQMERKFPGKNVRKFGYNSRGCPLFRNLCKFTIFYSALASSFGRDYIKLDISRKVDGDPYWKLESFYLHVDKY